MPTEKIATLRCIRCGETYSVVEMPEGCPLCLAQGRPSAVAPEFDLGELSGGDVLHAPKSLSHTLWRWHRMLPVPLNERVSLEEGGTPLVRLAGLEQDLGLEALWAKDERRNPTGSFKDRFFSVCMTRARQVGARVVTIASSGNGGSSAAAYAAAAGLTCVVVTTPKMSPAWRAAISVTGARLVATATSTQRWEAVRAGVEELGWYPLTNYTSPPVGSNWYGIEGYKTIAYEIAESLDWHAPDWVVIPRSRGDGLWGIWRGFLEMRELNLISSLPRMAAVERFPSLSMALDLDLDEAPAVESKPTLAGSIGDNIGTYQALHTLKQSGGAALNCSDDEMVEMVYVAGQHGLFTEVSSAAALAGVRKLVERGLARKGSRVVAVLTATGLTDPGAILGEADPLPVIDPTADALRDLLPTNGSEN